MSKDCSGETSIKGVHRYEYEKVVTEKGELILKVSKLQAALDVARENFKAIISAHKSGCVEYKNCQCWWQNAESALYQIEELLSAPAVPNSAPTKEGT